MDANKTITSHRFVPVYLRNSAVKALAKEGGKQCKEEFLMALDHHVARKIREACAVHNGGAKRLDAVVAGFVGIH